MDKRAQIIDSECIQLGCFHVKTAEIGRLFEIEPIQKSCCAELNVYFIR